MLESWPSDQHCIPAEEDMWHEDTPDCACKPKLVGKTADGHRLWQHNDMAPDISLH